MNDSCCEPPGPSGLVFCPVNPPIPVLEWLFSQRLQGPPLRGIMNNEDLTFGLTMTIVGMAGTLLSLWVLSLLISVLKKIFPLTVAKHASGGEK